MEENKKKQTLILWLLIVLLVALIAVIICLIVTVEKQKKQLNIVAQQQSVKVTGNKITTEPQTKDTNTLSETIINKESNYVNNVETSEMEKIIQTAVEEKIIGSWSANKVIDKNGNSVDLNTIFNSYEIGTGHISFNKDNTFVNERAGQEKTSVSYSISENTIKIFEDPIRLFSYNSVADTLTENKYINDNTYTVTYTRPVSIHHELSKEQVIDLLKEIKQANEKYSLDLYKLKVETIFGYTDKDDGKCTIIASYYVPDTLSESEYKNAVIDGQIIIDGETYVYKNDNKIKNKGYGYLVSKKAINSGIDAAGYCIYKIDNEYVLNDVPGLPSGMFVRNRISKTIKFETENTTEVVDTLGPITDKIVTYANANHNGTMYVELNNAKTDISFELDTH